MQFRTSFATMVAAVFTLTAVSAQTMKWIARFDGPAHGGDGASAIAVDRSGDAYVTGGSDDGNESHDYCTIKYDSNGNQEWVQRYSGPGYSFDRPSAIAVDAGGNAYVTGLSWGQETRDDYCTIKYDTNGNELWVQRFDGPAHQDDDASAMAVDASGNVYVTGRSAEAFYVFDYCTIKYDTNGNQMWIQRYDGPAHGNDAASAIGLDDSRNVYVTGNSAGSGGGSDLCTIKYDTNGNLMWLQRLDDPARSNDARAIAVDSSGNAYVMGLSEGPASELDYFTVRYDTNGNQMRVQRYDGPAHQNDASGIAVDAGGNAYVTGYSINAAGDSDFLTIMYLANAAVSGKVQLNTYSGGAGMLGTLEYQLPGTMQTLYSSPITLDANGNYQDAAAPVGIYDVACSFPNWLREVVPGVTIGMSGATANFHLANGDADGDNEVGFYDLLTVLIEYGKSGTPPLLGDVNWSGSVGIADLSSVLADFGKKGDP